MTKGNISTTEIARICGVSQGTVDRALNDRKGISPKTKEMILRVAREYGYRPNIHASTIAGGKSHLIGVVIFDLNNPYFSDMLMSIEAYCTSLGYSTVVMFTDKDHEKEIECIQSLYYMAVDGIILCPANSGSAYEKYLLSLNVPIVTLGNRLSGIPYVGIDNASASRDAVAHVLKKGYKKLIYVKPALKQRNAFAQAQRLDAFIAVCENEKAAYVVTDLQNAEKELDADTPCAIICPTDIYAIQLLSIAKKHSAGIIGFDNIRLIEELGLTLDSIAHNVPLTAKAAVDHIISGTPIDCSVPHQIIVRGSV
ncbi:MAG: LacI family DNA-binding transcriptional regulator [Oscillospiraceae bacterium]|nr:LacI family DNA-binding transcriptional regulator [Oscillospiraceae bacterium]